MNVDYFIDGIIDGKLHGWIVDTENLARHIAVKVYFNGNLFSETIANIRRQDLADKFHTSGHHSFVIDLEGSFHRCYDFDARLGDADQFNITILNSKRIDTLRSEVELRFPNEEHLLADGRIVELEARGLLRFKLPFIYVDTTEQTTIDFMNGVSLDKHALYVGTYRKSYVFGFHHLHGVLSEDGDFTCQELTRPQFRISIHNQFFGHIDTSVPKFRSHDGEKFYANFKTLKTPVRNLTGPVYFGSPIEPENWGMWLLNGIHSAANYVASGQVGRYMCYATTQWQKDLLSYVGVKSGNIIQQEPLVTYHVEELSLLQYSLIDLVLDYGALAALRAIRDRCLRNDSGPSPEKIFISRRSITEKLNGQRRLINEDEILAVAVQNGFSIVQPELLSFEEQVRIFAKAKVVVGIGGAAMFNTVFSNPGTKVVSIEGTRIFIINHARMFASLGLDYGFIIGQERQEHGRFPHNPWSVDAASVFAHLKRLGV